ncbi:MAG TPA: phosphatase PAP2 family protein [Rhodocyclaceae bacterium]
MRQSLTTLAAVALTGSLVGAIGLAVTGQVPAIDAAGLALADNVRRPALDAAFGTITWLGSIVVLLPLALVVALRVAPRLGWRAATLAPAVLLATTALAQVGKLVFERARPDLYPALTTMPADASFPSAHAAQAAAVALALLMHSSLAGRQRAVLAAGLGFLVGAVALSRIYLQVHFPSDVVAGLLLAVAVVIGLRALPFWRGAKL